MARLDESEEDFLAEEEEAEAEAEGQGHSGAVDDGGGENDAAGGGGGGGAPPSSPAAAFSFRNVSRLTVLGLGSLEGSRTSRLQAALALLLARVRFPRVVLLSPRKGAKAGKKRKIGTAAPSSPPTPSLRWPTGTLWRSWDFPSWHRKRPWKPEGRGGERVTKKEKKKKKKKKDQTTAFRSSTCHTATLQSQRRSSRPTGIKMLSDR